MRRILGTFCWVTSMSAGMRSNKIAVIGLGAMGYGIAASLARNGWPVVGADTNPAAVARSPIAPVSAKRFAPPSAGDLQELAPAHSGASARFL
jgi:UDP-N-acetylmuramoylalanine-D-glutamate ligase